MVQITTITSGLDSVSVSWTSSTGNGSDTCTIAFYDVTLYSQDSSRVHMKMMVTIKYHTFTGLPNNTLFEFILFAESLNGNESKVERRIVRTMMSESMYIHINVIM